MRKITYNNEKRPLWSEEGDLFESVEDSTVYILATIDDGFNSVSHVLVSLMDGNRYGSNFKLLTIEERDIFEQMINRDFLRIPKGSKLIIEV